MNLKIFLSTALFIFFIGANVFASPKLSMNDEGDDVLTLQKKLYLIGYTITEFDGIFGNETYRAVSAFQKDQNISVTGTVTNVTWRALKKAKPIAGRSLDNVEKQVAKVKTLFQPSDSNKTSASKVARNGKTFVNGNEGELIVMTGKKYLGTPYVFGGTTPDGFDCSGFVQYVFKQLGYNLPRLADEQYLLGQSAKVSQLDVGDLVFFETYMEGVSHCGIYVGNRKFLHVSSSRGVKVDSLDNEYWAPRFVGARKIVV